jgi:hypothetical protein
MGQPIVLLEARGGVSAGLTVAAVKIVQLNQKESKLRSLMSPKGDIPARKWKLESDFFQSGPKTARQVARNHVWRASE